MFSSRVVLLGGLPGIGSVGKVAADYLSLALETSITRSLYSRGFPPQVTVGDGLVSLFSAELRIPGDRSGLYLLTGDSQPLDVKNMYALSGEVLDAARSLGVTDVLTLAAYVGGVEGDVLGVTSDLLTAEELQKAGISLLRTGFIGGMNGLLVGLAPLYGLRGICLLGSTTGEEPVDLEAASSLLEAVNSLLGLGITRDDILLVDQEEHGDLPQDITEQEFDMTYR